MFGLLLPKPHEQAQGAQCIPEYTRTCLVDTYKVRDGARQDPSQVPYMAVPDKQPLDVVGFYLACRGATYTLNRGNFHFHYSSPGSPCHTKAAHSVAHILLCRLCVHAIPTPLTPPADHELMFVSTAVSLTTTYDMGSI
jgi:hypothetical protein